MSTSVDVNEPSASVTSSFLRPQGRTKAYAEGGKRVAGGKSVAIGLLIAIGLALYVAGMIYLHSLVSTADLPDLGQIVGP